MRALRLTCALTTLLWLVTATAEAQGTANKFGVITHDATFHYPAPAYPEIVNADLGWVRLHAFWRLIEVEPGACTPQEPDLQKCKWSNLDDNVNAAYQRGLQIYIGIGFWPPAWANNSDPLCGIHTTCAAKAPTNVAFYPAFVKALVRRYKDRVKYYAIWNEPDLSTNWNVPSNSTDRFVREILLPGAKAIREEAPLATGVKIIAGEVADDHNMLGNMLWSGYGTCGKVDIIAVHLFRYDVKRNTDHLKLDYLPKIDATCGTGMPVWVTAFGFPMDEITPPAGVDKVEYQGQLYRDQFAALDAIPRVGRIIFFNLVDSADPDQRTGLLTGSYGRKPVFTKLQAYLATPQTIWVEDSVPAGATAVAEGGDSWSWTNANPPPLSGALNHQSSLAAGMHQHYFVNATQTLTVNAGDVLTAFVYLDPATLPTEIMLQWNDGSSWDHRAYWGADNITWFGPRVSMGPLPSVQAAKWVRLEVPASAVGLEGRTVSGMAFTLYGGKATWDRAGKRTGSPAP
jgi:hypothetical protein